MLSIFIFAACFVGTEPAYAADNQVIKYCAGPGSRRRGLWCDFGRRLGVSGKRISRLSLPSIYSWN